MAYFYQPTHPLSFGWEVIYNDNHRCYWVTTLSQAHTMHIWRIQTQSLSLWQRDIFILKGTKLQCPSPKDLLLENLVVPNALFFPKKKIWYHFAMNRLLSWIMGGSQAKAKFKAPLMTYPWIHPKPVGSSALILWLGFSLNISGIEILSFQLSDKASLARVCPFHLVLLQRQVRCLSL